MFCINDFFENMPTEKKSHFVKLTFVLGKAERMFNHHFASSGHVPFTNVTRSGAVTANEFKWPVTSSAVETSSTFVISIHACGIVSGWKKKNSFRNYFVRNDVIGNCKQFVDVEKGKKKKKFVNTINKHCCTICKYLRFFQTLSAKYVVRFCRNFARC